MGRGAAEKFAARLMAIAHELRVAGDAKPSWPTLEKCIGLTTTDAETFARDLELTAEVLKR